VISADQYPVADVLGDKFIHEIPLYQRPFAWTSEQALQLIDDLREYVEANPAAFDRSSSGDA
jgi:uncharacterized protein with ParB-like and HNH nuclease domain